MMTFPEFVNEVIRKIAKGLGVDMAELTRDDAQQDAREPQAWLVVEHRPSGDFIHLFGRLSARRVAYCDVFDAADVYAQMRHSTPFGFDVYELRPPEPIDPWRPIEEAPKDRTEVLVRIRPDHDEARHAGRCFVALHPGVCPDGFDVGWSLYPGYGGVSDESIAGWTPLPPPVGGDVT